MARTFVVAGGGITGLSAAYALTMRAGPGDHVVVLEGSPRLGGKIETVPFAGGLVEAGPDWFVTRSPEAVALCGELGLGAELVAPAVAGALVWTRGALRHLPAGSVRGVPPSARDALRAGLVSRLGAVRALADYVLPGPLSGPDVSVGALVGRRLGREMLERVVEPVLAASRAGGSRALGLAAAAPELDDIARSSRSLMRGVAGAPAPEPGTPFLGVTGGMQRLVDRLAGALVGADIRISTPVRAVAAEPDGVVVEAGSGAPIRADGVVLAVPAFAAADAVGPLSPDAARILRSIAYAPAAVVALAYPPGARRPPAGYSGLLVPARDRRTMTACAWFSDKWAHARSSTGALIARAFVAGRPGDGAPDGDALVEPVARDIARATGISGPVEHVSFTWDAAMPVYGVGHASTVAAAEAALGTPRVVLAGAAYRGSGLPQCIAQGSAAADELLSGARL